jgi:HSP20 family molecular chaperone IbpA
MWAEACQLLEQAERLHRQFFRLSAPGTRVAWEPPVDVFENDGEITIVVALPGVSPESVEVLYEPHGIVVRAERRIPFAERGYAIGRLEIPYGCFERRLALPAGELQAGTRSFANGCLVLTLRKHS